MRGTTTSKLERLFTILVTALAPAGAALTGASCGGISHDAGSGQKSASGSSSGTTSSGAGSSGTGSSGTGSSSGNDCNGAPNCDCTDGLCSWGSSASGGTSSGSSGDGGSSGTSSSGGACGSACGEEVTLDGGLPDANAFDASAGVVCGMPLSECQELCGFAQGFAPPSDCTVVSAGPPVVLKCGYMCAGGRRPASLECETIAGESSPGHYFASLAQLEAASVPAFRRMARELSRHGAPRKLVKAAERAAREEVRHARGATALARKYGGARGAFDADVRGERSLEEIAIENAVEGCVRETYGALVATWQAREARDPQVRAHMARIAREETSHAALAWRTHAWARARLAKDARARVDAARADAVRTLLAEVAHASVAADVARVAGLPAANHATLLASRLAEALA